MKARGKTQKQNKFVSRWTLYVKFKDHLHCFPEKKLNSNQNVQTLWSWVLEPLCMSQTLFFKWNPSQYHKPKLQSIFTQTSQRMEQSQHASVCFTGHYTILNNSFTTYTDKTFVLQSIVLESTLIITRVIIWYFFNSANFICCA